jgi:hypothetical protein
MTIDLNKFQDNEGSVHAHASDPLQDILRMVSDLERLREDFEKEKDNFRTSFSEAMGRAAIQFREDMSVIKKDMVLE